jgi:hypothetical protein
VEIQGTYLPTLERQAEELESVVRATLSHHAQFIEGVVQQEHLANLCDDDPSSRPTQM